MATATEIKNFIKTIGPLIQAEAKKNGYKVASPIIAQACIESAYGKSILSSKYYNYFGLKCGSYWKGKSVNLSTKEEYTTGTLTTIKDNFRVYDSMAEGVAGYFEFISTTRYKNLKTAKTAQVYLERIKADGYATSSTYVATNMAIVEKYNLTEYDDFTKTKTSTKKETKKETNKKAEKVEAAQNRDDKLAGTYKATVDVNMRTGAGTSKAIIKVIKKGQKVKNYGYYSKASKGTKWLYIQDNDEQVGFIASTYLAKQ